MPQNRTISGLIESKVTKVSKGLSHISTTVDPDWEGNLLIAMHNYSNGKIKLRYGEPFCTIVFLTNLSPSDKPCEKQPGRLDIFLDKFDEETARGTKKRQIHDYAPPLIVLVSAVVGYYLFGNNPGFVATVAVGVVLSQFFTAKLK